MSTGANFEPLWYWINERHAIWLRKHYAIAPGKCDPLYNHKYDPLGPGTIPGDVSPDEARNKIYTHDPILRDYRFCNVFRELDRVTIWIREHISAPYADHPHLWYMLAAARTINWPPTLNYLIGDPLASFPDRIYSDAWPDSPSFSPKGMGDALDDLKSMGQKIYTGAYMIRAESNPKAEWYNWTKQQYVAQIVLGRLWEDKAFWEKEALIPGRTLESCWEWLKQERYMGWGPFMSFQTVLDWRHSRYLSEATDASSWAAIGPGSMRGLNRLFGRPVGFKVPQAQALHEMQGLLEVANWPPESRPLAFHVPPLEIEDIQNSLCETDKYLRVKLKQGEPRSRYIPGRGF